MKKLLTYRGIYVMVGGIIVTEFLRKKASKRKGDAPNKRGNVQQ